MCCQAERFGKGYHGVAHADSWLVNKVTGQRLRTANRNSRTSRRSCRGPDALQALEQCMLRVDDANTSAQSRRIEPIMGRRGDEGGQA